MKQIISFLLAGFIGGITTYGLILYKNPIKSDTALSEKTSYFAGYNAPLDFTKAADKALDAVVHIKATESPEAAENRFRQSYQQRSPFSFFLGEDDLEGFFGYGPRTKQGTGSGVIISPNGYIVTNNHVVDFADMFEVTLHDNKKYEATLVGRDPITDLAVLKIEAGTLPSIEYGNSDNSRIGEWVLAVGNPFNLSSTVTAGIISAKNRNINVNRNDGAVEDFIQTDAAVNPGNSGGALVDTNGKLIGINTAIASPTGAYAGYSFAIPANRAKSVIEKIMKNYDPKAVASNNGNNNNKKPKLGIALEEVDYDLASELKLPVDKGIYVRQVLDGSAAQSAGLLANDVIVRVNNSDISSAQSLQNIIGNSRVGDVLNLTVNRNGKIKEIPVKLKA
jgi:serine protease Do